MLTWQRFMTSLIVTVSVVIPFVEEDEVFHGGKINWLRTANGKVEINIKDNYIIFDFV